MLKPIILEALELLCIGLFLTMIAVVCLALEG